MTKRKTVTRHIALELPVLPSYDPDWEARHEQATIMLRAHNKLPDYARDIMYDQAGEVLQDMVHAAFNAQFETSYDYAQFYVARMQQSAAGKGVQLGMPKLAPDATLAEVQQYLNLGYAKMRQAALADHTSQTKTRQSPRRPLTAAAYTGEPEPNPY